MISQVESFLCPDKQGTPEEGQRIQRLKHCEKKNKDEDNSPKTLTDKNHQASSQKFIKFHLRNLSNFCSFLSEWVDCLEDLVWLVDFEAGYK